ncbi:uncharacterized protein BJ171DRAFT_489314 [Polychytrium aggregatum]|uniref:uncharacterized protein n=1 Tax=Polychytrium aggregatum TaxID=110093 RepID=UPI0022FDCC29|nr:uncharacterized protein BJ171DRAFT_489314 [Polychytrium aggregatum]KAI9208555.1 hypothetical protein BJ171DRAFT_489314 [Polychytrium aggregatum]
MDPTADSVEASSSTVAEPQPSVTPAAPQSEWDKHWEIVTKNPEDFSSWEYLIGLAEQPSAGPISAESPEADKANVRKAYDHFLAKFPLCFVYWKKYAALVLLMDGPSKAEEVYERAVQGIHNSIDLWIDYCEFKARHSTDEEEIRGIYARGAAAVGLDFLSHPFWLAYIQFEESKQKPGNVLTILEKTIATPLRDYQQFFDKYTQVAAALPVKELVSSEEYAQIEGEVRTATQDNEAPQTDEAVEAEVRQRIQASRLAIFNKNQDQIRKRWSFEFIKRTYFHVKSLDEAALSNWRSYLDFEEQEGDAARIRALYERCLVPCAMYEEFWQRYTRYLASQGDIDGARGAFVRATTIFLSPQRPLVHLAYAAFEEEQGQIQEARAAYKRLITAVPGHVEATIKFAQFERRSGKIEDAEEVLSSAISNTEDAKLQAYFTVYKAKLAAQHKLDNDAARQIYEEASSKFLNSKFLWTNWLLFEIHQTSDSALSYSKVLWEAIQTRSTLSSEEKGQLGQRYREFLLERDTTISALNELERELSTLIKPTSSSTSPGSRKRPIEDSGHSHSYKQHRTDEHEHSASASSAPASGYYGSWGGQQGQHGQQGYGGGYGGQSQGQGQSYSGYDQYGHGGSY